MPFARPTLQELIDRSRADLSARLPGADARLRRSVLEILARIHAGAVHGLYSFLVSQSRDLFVETSGDVALLRWASFYSTDRLAAQFASGTVLATGANGIEIPSGTELIRGDGEEYTTTALATIVAGSVSVPVVASIAGASGNATSGTVLSFVSPIPSIDATATVEAAGIISGVDEESIEALRSRTLRRKRTPPRGGHARDYEAWALEVPGVTRAWATEREYGQGTVGVTFVRDGDPDGLIPDAADVAAVLAYLLTHTDPATGRTEGKPATVDLTVVAPTTVTQLYTIQLTPDTTAVRAAVEAELDDLHLRKAIPNGTIFLSQIREAVSAAAGEENNVVTVPSADVTTIANQIAIRGTVTWV